MCDCRFQVISNDPNETDDLAASIAVLLRPGDVILLQGPVGAGKSHFARALIRTLQTEPDDIPSPTFTLVQTYDTRSGEIWHSDLYRLSGIEEIEELGLLEAFQDAICLIEWPDRLGDLRPRTALNIDFEMAAAEDKRTITFSWLKGSGWRNRLTGVRHA